MQTNIDDIWFKSFSEMKDVYFNHYKKYVKHCFSVLLDDKYSEHVVDWFLSAYEDTAKSYLFGQDEVMHDALSHVIHVYVHDASKWSTLIDDELPFYVMCRKILTGENNLPK